VALRNLKSDRSVLSIFTYSYDAVGNRLAVAEAQGFRSDVAGGPQAHD